MTDDPLYHQWLEALWRGKFTPAQEAELKAWLACHPEAKAAWQDEAGLNAALDRLADAPPLSPQFTARVMEVVQDWQAETQLNAALERLGQAPPVSSNFTARVLQAVALEEAARARASRPKWHVWRLALPWLPQAAMAAVLVSAGLFSAHEVQTAHRRTQLRRELAESVAAVWDISSLPSPKILEDFDSIRVLGQTPPPDEQLLSLLQ